MRWGCGLFVAVLFLVGAQCAVAGGPLLCSTVNLEVTVKTWEGDFGLPKADVELVSYTIQGEAQEMGAHRTTGFDGKTIFLVNGPVYEGDKLTLKATFDHLGFAPPRTVTKVYDFQNNCENTQAEIRFPEMVTPHVAGVGGAIEDELCSRCHGAMLD